MSDKPIAGGVKIMELREDYQKLMEKQLNEWKAQTERFKAGAEKIEAHNKSQYEKNLEMLHTTQADAWENFNKLKGANESTWSEFKALMDKAGGEVKAAVERMTTSFKH
jgi:vacuolar-type H+-ATPase subunit I/STV1